MDLNLDKQRPNLGQAGALFIGAFDWLLAVYVFGIGTVAVFSGLAGFLCLGLYLLFSAFQDFNQPSEGEELMAETKQLVEPIIDVNDEGGQSTEIRVGQKVAEALCEENRARYQLAFENLKAIGPKPEFDWWTVNTVEEYLSAAADAIGVLRALTPQPEEKTAADA